MMIIYLFSTVRGDKDWTSHHADSVMNSNFWRNKEQGGRDRRPVMTSEPYYEMLVVERLIDAKLDRITRLIHKIK